MIYDQLPEKQNEDVSRRQFLKWSAAFCACAALPGVFLPGSKKLWAANDDVRFVKKARYFDTLQHRKIKCKLCPRECVIDDHERGYCGVRENRDGQYYTLVYARPCTYHVDPIEKKPLFHFLPGSTAFSIATAGCNLNCKFCQNWQISQVTPEQINSYYLPPEQVAKLSADYRAESMAYTYNEPTIFFEFMYDTAIQAKKYDLNNVVITAGFIQQQPVEDLCKVVDAIKIDLKAFRQKYYEHIVRGELKPVLKAIETIHKQNVWLEIVYLVVPTLNDGEDEIRDLARWMKQNIGPDVPIHFTRFYPQYLLKNLPPTPISTLERCKAIADAEGLHYVYIGNVPGHSAEHTYCPRCNKILIERMGFVVRRNALKNGHCPDCGTKIPGKW